MAFGDALERMLKDPRFKKMCRPGIGKGWWKVNPRKRPKRLEKKLAKRGYTKDAKGWVPPDVAFLEALPLRKLYRGR